MIVDISNPGELLEIICYAVVTADWWYAESLFLLVF